MRWHLIGVVLAISVCKQPGAAHHLELARVALFEKKPQVSLAEYKLTLDLLDRDTSAEADLYRARALRGAADVYAFSAKDPKRAVEVYRELIRRCPEAPETLEGRLHLARLLRHDFRDLRGSIAELKAALARNPPQSAELAYEVATLYFELGDYAQCELEAAEVASRYETSVFVDEALYLRGQALALLEGRHDQAERVYLDLIDRFPESSLMAHSLMELGRLKAGEGQYEKAIERWVEALRTHPDPKVVQNAIARARTQMRATTPGKVGDATRAFDRDKPGAIAERRPAKSSLEALGLSDEEAKREAPEPLSPAAPKQPATAPEPTPEDGAEP
jgi:tetratricopeptide (TPR) repeat protein